ncbi:hypothetical protein [Bremerella cremea]|uniref:carboxypeptidase-like regulatory domain-containing protein n=1 Tax=Bremerella cremea TaxID=1031537 RepID=UPI0031E84999
MPTRGTLFLLLWALPCLIFTGCAESNQAESLGATAEGTVLLNGSPVEGAMVTLRSADRGLPSAFGRTDADGKFQLATSTAKSGVAPGEYRVVITKFETTAADIPSEDDPNYAGGMNSQSQAVSVLPKKYADAAPSPFKVTISEGDNTFDFPLEN